MGIFKGSPDTATVNITGVSAIQCDIATSLLIYVLFEDLLKVPFQPKFQCGSIHPPAMLSSLWKYVKVTSLGKDLPQEFIVHKTR